MKTRIIILFSLLLCSLAMSAQKYVVNGRKDKTRVVEYHMVDGHWTYVKGARDIYVPKGYEFEAVAPVSKDTIVMPYEGKFYRVVFPDKELKLVDDMGKDSHLGFRNKLSNTVIGKWYATGRPAVIGLILSACALLALVVALFRENVPAMFRALFVASMCGISLLEVGAFLSLHTDAFWWVNPDDVGYLVAIMTLIPFSVTVAMQVFALKVYNMMGNYEGALNAIVKIILVIGIVLSFIFAIAVIMNFLFAACLLIGAGFLFSGMSYKDSAGNTIHSSALGTYKTDKYGNTTHIH
ncbi:MAG: hypothetical protein K2M19_03810 [Muribaculaceae bacterium]|nr:hypothetical protein [Muribaculaceae bacterium]